MRQPRVRAIAASAVVALLTMAFGGVATAAPPSSATPTPIPVKILANLSNDDGEYTTAMINSGIAKKYGLDVTIVPEASSSATPIILKSGRADVSPGSVISVYQYRKDGIPVQVFDTYEHYLNPIVVLKDSSVKSFAQLKGQKIGTFTTTSIDWMVLRAVVFKAYHYDIATQSTPVVTTNALLNEMLNRHQIPAALQFESLAAGPIAAGQYRVLATIPQIMKKAGFNPNTFYTIFMVTKAWEDKYPGGVQKLYEAFNATFKMLLSKEGQWPTIAKQMGISGAAGLKTLIQTQRPSFDLNYSQSLFAPTKKLIDQLISINTAKVVGFDPSDVTESAFVWPPKSA